MYRLFHNSLCSLIAICLLLASGCTQNTPGGDESPQPGKQSHSDTENAPEEQPVSSTDVEQEAQEALNVSREYTSQQMEQFRSDAEQRLQSIQTRIEELHTKAADNAAEAQASLREELDAIEDKVAETRNSLRETGTDTAEAWSEFQKGVGDAIDELKESVDKAQAEFNDDSSTAA